MSDLAVRLTPRGGRTAVDGLRDGVLHVRVAAPPVNGEANRALIELLSRTLRVPRTTITIVSGETARRKIVRFDGLSEAVLAERLGVERAT